MPSNAEPLGPVRISGKIRPDPPRSGIAPQMTPDPARYRSGLTGGAGQRVSDAAGLNATRRASKGGRRGRGTDPGLARPDVMGDQKRPTRPCRHAINRRAGADGLLVLTSPTFLEACLPACRPLPHPSPSPQTGGVGGAGARTCCCPTARAGGHQGTLHQKLSRSSPERSSPASPGAPPPKCAMFPPPLKGHTCQSPTP